MRGIEGTRKVVLMNEADIARLGLAAGEPAEIVTAIGEGRPRSVAGLRVVPYGIPAGCCACYYPEGNPLIPSRTTTRRRRPRATSCCRCACAGRGKPPRTEQGDGRDRS